MDPGRWKRVDRILQQALTRPPESVSSFLEDACAGDEELRREVESLIEHDRRAAEFIGAPVFGSERAGDSRKTHPDFVGRTLLHYRIVEKIGEGGMGVVYRAEDAHLRRSVAIKVLPPGKIADPERKKRFIHGARAASALNHPNIVTIYDISEADGIDFIAMEYVPGKPLAQLTGTKGMPLRQVLSHATQICDALEKAHRAGIVHRDLKPSNILVTEDGLVKVVDFGLAKLTHPAQGEDICLTESSETLTRSGAIVGTVAYMSPEQAEGRAVDARSDVFSFGAVLYEMVTGRRAFKGNSSISTLSAILHEEPEPVTRVVSGIPHELERIIARCLKKDPVRRFQHMDDVKVALEELKEDAANRGRLKPVHSVIAAALAVLALGVWTLSRFLPREAALPPTRIVPVTNYQGVEWCPSLSPNGTWMAFSWNGERQDNYDIYVKEVDGLGFNRLTKDPAEDSYPAWSPDGRQIAFVRISGDRSDLYVVSAPGGTEQKLTEYLGWQGLSWSADGTKIAIAAKHSPGEPWSIWSLDVKSREMTRLTTPGAGVTFGDILPAYSPDGRYLAFIRCREAVTLALYVMRLPHGEPKLVTEYNNPQFMCWTADSRELVYSSAGETGESTLFRVSRDGGDVSRIAARGENPMWPSVGGHRLAYFTWAARDDLWKMELSETEVQQPPAMPLISWTTDEQSPHISPDGTSIVFISNRSGSFEVWKCNNDGSNPEQLTDMRATSTGSPRWSPDGKLIAFDSTKYGNTDLFLVGAEGGPVRPITTETTEEVVPRWSRDGRWI
jgi:eukaryotic-like serine/threonine-protein kinase